MAKAVADAFEGTLQIEVASDTPEKVDRYMAWLTNRITEDFDMDEHDVAVTVRDTTDCVPSGGTVDGEVKP